MIDTDKYEGHTPAPWFYYDDGGLSDYIRLYHTPFMDTDNDDTEEDLAQIHYDENCIADARLIADAPLLLEAYKRLRLVADELYLHIVGEPHMTLDELVAEMPWRNEE